MSGGLREELKRWRKLDAWIVPGSTLHGWFFLELARPTQFTEPHEQLVKRLMPRDAAGKPDAERAKEVLEEAQAIYDGVEDRVASAASRATALQGAVAIATSLLLAGGALLADPTKVRGDGWRVGFACGLLAVVGCLVMTGARALTSSSQVHGFQRPARANIFGRAASHAALARIDLAAELLKSFGYNATIADWKVAYMRAATWWFRWALVALFLLAVLIAAYGIWGPDPPPPAPGS
jgi:hypothetical protein